MDVQALLQKIEGKQRCLQFNRSLSAAPSQIKLPNSPQAQLKGRTINYNPNDLGGFGFWILTVALANTPLPIQPLILSVGFRPWKLQNCFPTQVTRKAAVFTPTPTFDLRIKPLPSFHFWLVSNKQQIDNHSLEKVQPLFSYLSALASVAGPPKCCINSPVQALPPQCSNSGQLCDYHAGYVPFIW